MHAISVHAEATKMMSQVLMRIAWMSGDGSVHA
jgi:hypothetical protein